ncbi:MAG: NfeD family protein [Lachnospiraceae bacterium]
MPLISVSNIEMNAILWLAIMVLCIIIESVTVGLYTIWFAGGCLVAFFASLMGFGVWTQAGICLIVSGILIIFARPVAQRKLSIGKVKTNVEELIGEKARVIEKIDNIAGTGRAIVRGQEWMARSEDDAVTFDEESIVIINKISGVKLIVKKEED